jgi:hypothetical protein
MVHSVAEPAGDFQPQTAPPPSSAPSEEFARFTQFRAALRQVRQIA